MKIKTEQEIRNEIPDKFNNISFDNENFRKAYSLILSDDAPPIVFIFGAGGCGKSVLFQIAAHMKRCLCMAPTGVAAKNVNSAATNAKTLQAALKVPIAKNYPLGFNQKTFEVMQEYDLILVDEVSMITSNFLDFILYHSLLAQKRIVFFGDPLQLESVYKGFCFTDIKNRGRTEEEKKDIAYANIENIYPLYLSSTMFYDSLLYGMNDSVGAIGKVFLNAVYRQKDNTFKDVLARLRVGKYTRQEQEYLAQFVREPAQGALVLAYKKETVEDINLSNTTQPKTKEDIKGLKEPSAFFNWNQAEQFIPCYGYTKEKFRSIDKQGKEFTTIKMLKKPSDFQKINTELLVEDTVYFVGERVMCTKNIYTESQNDEEREMIAQNGSLGYIVYFEEQEIGLSFKEIGNPLKLTCSKVSTNIPYVLFDGDQKPKRIDLISNHVDVYNKRLEQYIEDSTSCYYIPLAPAYAITYNKSQGLTIAKAHLIIDKCVENFPSVLYLGLSRLKSPEGLSIDRVPDRLTVNQNSVKYLEDINISSL